MLPLSAFTFCSKRLVFSEAIPLHDKKSGMLADNNLKYQKRLPKSKICLSFPSCRREALIKIISLKF